MTNIDSIITELTKPDAERDWASEVEQAFLSLNVKPDQNTLNAATALSTAVGVLIEAAVGDDVDVKDDKGNSKGSALKPDGSLSDELASSIRGGSFIAALARDEEKDSPFKMMALIVKGLVDDDDKSTRASLAKKALDNIRKGINVVPA